MTPQPQSEKTHLLLTLLSGLCQDLPNHSSSPFNAPLLEQSPSGLTICLDENWLSFSSLLYSLSLSVCLSDSLSASLPSFSLLFSSFLSLLFIELELS